MAPCASQFGAARWRRVFPGHGRFSMAAIFSPGGEALGGDGFDTGRRGVNSHAETESATSSFATYRHARAVTPTPGAGSYNLAGSMVKQGRATNQRGYSSMIGETQRSVRDLQRERQPGPGAYDPFSAKEEATARRMQTQAAQRARPMHDSHVPPPLDVLPPDPTPGPAHYDQTDSLKSQKHGGSHSAFRCGVDRFDSAKSKKSNGPSPAEYNDLHTRYNSGFTDVTYKTGSTAPHSSSLSKPITKEIPKGAMIELCGVKAPVLIADSKRRNAVPKKNTTRRVTSAAATRNTHKPGLPSNAPTPNGYTSFGMKHDSREARDWYNTSTNGNLENKKRNEKKNVASVPHSVFRSGGVALRKHSKPVAPPAMRPITSELEIVEFYEMKDRAFEKGGRNAPTADPFDGRRGLSVNEW